MARWDYNLTRLLIFFPQGNAFMSSNSRFTPFMLFVKRTRPKLLESNPGLDYSSLTQTLIDIWSKMSSGEKFLWNQKLMKMTNPTQFQQNQSPMTQKVVKLVVQQPSNTNRSPQTVKKVSVTPYNKIPGLEPIGNQLIINVVVFFVGIFCAYKKSAKKWWIYKRNK